jgi:hypothetical protein
MISLWSCHCWLEGGYPLLSRAAYAFTASCDGLSCMVHSELAASAETTWCMFENLNECLLSVRNASPLRIATCAEACERHAPAQHSRSFIDCAEHEARLTPIAGSTMKRFGDSAQPSTVASSARRGRGSSAPSSSTTTHPRSDGSGFAAIRQCGTWALRLEPRAALSTATCEICCMMKYGGAICKSRGDQHTMTTLFPYYCHPPTISPW